MLAVKDILKRPYFQDIQIFAGDYGLDQAINWVHIVEIENFGHLLNGEEMILTTGVKWANDEAKGLHFLQQLIDHHVSVLCVDFNDKTDSLPLSMIELAKKNHFPIIIFNKEVKFIDITKDIHGILLRDQENFWWKLEDLSKELNQTLVSNHSIADFLKILHQFTNKQIAMSQNADQYSFFPPQPETVEQQWKEELARSPSPSLYYSIPIYFLNEQIAELYIYDAHYNISLFDKLAVNRCSEFLTQFFWKYRQQAEVRRVRQNEWVLDAIYGKLTSEEVTSKLQQSATIKLHEALIAVIPYLDDLLSTQKHEGLLSSILMSLRPIFDREGFYLFGAKDKQSQCFILLLIDQQGNDNVYKRLNSCWDRLNNLNRDKIIYEQIKWLSFGKTVNEYSQLRLSYQAALSTLDFQKNVNMLKNPFYSNLTIYRLLAQVTDKNELNDIIHDYIGPLLAYDSEKGTELLRTLQIYLKNLGSKNETARELFIVRQTLYHRLDRIKQLIGEDYLDPKKRVMIEFSMYTLEYLERDGTTGIPGILGG